MRLFEPTASLGTLLRDFRRSQALGIRELALRLGLSLDRMRELEGDAALPNVDEAAHVGVLLGLPALHVLRAVRQTALDLLADAISGGEGKPARLIAARQFKPTDTPPPAVEDPFRPELPVRLERALAACLKVDAADGPAFHAALRSLAQQSASAQRRVMEGVVSRLTLDGEPDAL